MVLGLIYFIVRERCRRLGSQVELTPDPGKGKQLSRFFNFQFIFYIQ